MLDILYFARIREQLGVDREQIPWREELGRVVDVIELLCSSRGELWRQTLNQDNLLISVNQTMAGPDHEISEGDEIAFFPPVTGG